MVRRTARGHAPSQRQQRVGETLRHALAEILGRRELRDPALAGRSITVSEVRVSPDMRAAVAYVSPLGGGDIDAVLAGLRRAAPHLGAQLAREITLKNTPRLQFEADRSFDAAGRLETILRRPDVARDLAPAPPAEDGDER